MSSLSAGEAAGPPPPPPATASPAAAASSLAWTPGAVSARARVLGPRPLPWPPARPLRAAPGEPRALQIACQGREQRFTRFTVHPPSGTRVYTDTEQSTRSPNGGPLVRSRTCMSGRPRESSKATPSNTRAASVPEQRPPTSLELV